MPAKIGSNPTVVSNASETAAQSPKPQRTKAAAKPKVVQSAEASEKQAKAGAKGAAFLGGKKAKSAEATATAKPATAGALAEAQKKADSKVSEVFFAPTSRSSTTLRFIMPGYGGKEIKPGERWLFEVPEDLRGANIRTVILAHRKDSKYGASVKNDYDSEGAYNLVTARNATSGSWVTWRDQYGSKKFAEPRSSGDPENENLHDWLASVGQVPVDLLAVTNVGNGQNAVANVHFVEIEFFPAGKVESEIERVFTPGTKFVDPNKGIKEPRYGGGMGGHLSAQTLKENGMYPNSIQLGGYGSDKVVDDTISIKNGRMHIKLPPGKTLGGLEVSVGDTVFDKNRPASEQKNKDGHYGRLGYAKLSARLQNAQDQSGGSYGKPFMDRINVPPSGVLSGGPIDAGYVTKPGDEIVIDASSGAWVMGVRVQFTEV